MPKPIPKQYPYSVIQSDDTGPIITIQATAGSGTYALQHGDYITFLENKFEIGNDDKLVWSTVPHCAKVLVVDINRIDCHDYNTKTNIVIPLKAGVYTKDYDWSTINKKDTPCSGAGNGSIEGGKRRRRTRQARRQKNRRTRSRK